MTDETARLREALEIIEQSLAQAIVALGDLTQDHPLSVAYVTACTALAPTDDETHPDVLKAMDRFRGKFGTLSLLKP